MTRSAEAAVQAAKLAELKRIITANSFDSVEKLEEAVDAFLWADDELDEPAADSPFDPKSQTRLRPR